MDAKLEQKARDTEKMRAASYLLPEPGGEVVRECLDKIDALERCLAEAMEEIDLLKLQAVQQSRALQAQPAEGGVGDLEHMELKVNATALCEELVGLIFSMWVMGDGLDYHYNNVPVSEIVAGLKAAETAKEMMDAFDGLAAPKPATTTGEGVEGG